MKEKWEGGALAGRPGTYGDSLREGGGGRRVKEAGGAGRVKGLMGRAVVLVWSAAASILADQASCLLLGAGAMEPKVVDCLNDMV